MTMMLLNTSEAEWTASLIMAPEWARMPASSFKRERSALPRMLTTETRVAMVSNSCAFAGAGAEGWFFIDENLLINSALCLTRGTKNTHGVSMSQRTVPWV